MLGVKQCMHRDSLFGGTLFVPATLAWLTSHTPVEKTGERSSSGWWRTQAAEGRTPATSPQSLRRPWQFGRVTMKTH